MTPREQLQLMPLAPSNVVSFAVALGAGLLIGIERERRKGAGPDRALAGVRTFTLTSLAGALAQALQQPLLVALDSRDRLVHPVTRREFNVCRHMVLP
jgi:uncharacterized membrane protein YhiD involved in acid resistance